MLVYALAAFGFAYIVGHAKISLPIRLAIEPDPPKRVSDDEGSSIRRVKTRETFSDSLRWWLLMLIECPACVGFWVGLLSFGRLFTPAIEGGVSGRWAGAFQLALFTCASNLLLAKLAGLMEEGKADDERE